MRTTVRLADDVAAAADQLRRERHISLSDAVNELARAGLPRLQASSAPFQQRTARLRAKVDLTNVGEVLDLIDDVSGS